MNQLYFGDNLDVLREKVKDETVDLVYLDPPFNSDANYNVLFKHGGLPSQAQAEAFRDTWDWGEGAALAYDEVMRANGDAALVLSGLRKWLGENAMMAYLAMMTVRLLELRRVLKPTGSLYLHCDSTASHYLKLLLDAVFSPANFKNHITWQRSDAHSDARRKWPAISDHILFYTQDADTEITPQYKSYPEKTLREWYLYLEMPDGNTRRMTKEEIETQEIPASARRFNTADMSAPAGGGMAAINKQTGKPNGWHVYKGYQPPQRGWRYSPETMAELDAKGRLLFPADPSGRIMLKRYLDEQKGVIVGDIWDDIQHIRAAKIESLGYPTQKPVALLERILSASSQEGQVVLDPFCGCGTTVEAAEKLNRQWIGIDVTHYAITLIERRLARARINQNSYQVIGRPTDLAGARDLARRDKHQFQWWAAWRLGARWYREEKKGADRGIDGRMMFKNGPYGDGLIIISVKGGENVGVQMVRDLRGVVEREEAQMGILVSLAEPTGPMKNEAAAAGFVSKSAHGQLPRLQIITIEEMLDGHMPKLPPLPLPERLDRVAPRRKFKDQLELLLPFAGDKVAPAKGDFVDPSIMAIG